jgi:2-dehydro-3-deoxyphosphogluconate aldolase/(4S)-4-hydroxy-2-oxoglutarate aldolase
MSAAEALAGLESAGVVPVLRFHHHAAARKAVADLLEAGFRTFEITLTIPDALRLVRELAARDDVLVGAGTITTEAQAIACLEAGARFVVSPFLLPALPRAARAADAASIVGALTPSEIHQAVEAGADAVKVFPAHSVGGPAYLHAVRAVIPGVPLIPTGGVTLDNLPDYLEAGCRIVGVGSDLFAARDAVARARRYLDAVAHFRTRTSRT